MSNISFCASPRNHISTSIELSNQSDGMTPATAAGTHLYRRYHVSAGVADLVALLAGLGEQAGAR